MIQFLILLQTSEDEDEEESLRLWELWLAGFSCFYISENALVEQRLMGSKGNRGFCGALAPEIKAWKNTDGK